VTALYWGWAHIDERGATEAGRQAARAALAQLDEAYELAYDGSRPVIRGPSSFSLSISHGKSLAVAVVGRCTAIGVDLCEVDRGPTIRRLAERFLEPSERALIEDDHSAAAIWAAKEAGLKARGFGIYESGLLDDPRTCSVMVASLAPPRYSNPELALQLQDRDDAVVALAYADQTAPSTTTVAPFM